MEEIAERNPVVKEMLRYEDMYRVDPITYRNYLIDERARIDFADLLEDTRKESREEERARLARMLKADGLYTDEQIAEKCELPISLIQSF